MAYPDNIDRFAEKLNKKTDSSVYVIEEKLPITAGIFEGLLAHDNINNNTVRVFTGPKLTGQEINNVVISIPGDTPWRRLIKIYTGASEVYVTYETPGDTVEAADINTLQESITLTQTEIEKYKSIGMIDGGNFIKEGE